MNTKHGSIRWLLAWFLCASAGVVPGADLAIRLTPALVLTGNPGEHCIIERAFAINGPYSLLTNLVLTSSRMTVIDESGTSQCFYRITLPPTNALGDFVWIASLNLGMGRCEVTQAEYQRITGSNPSVFKGGFRPVEFVSWNEATNYCALRTAQEQAAGTLSAKACYRLPTEVEWEYACRAGSTNAYCFGDNVAQLVDYAWYVGNSDNTTHDVGLKQSNAWGLHDMHGNVFEWCLDWYDIAYPPLSRVVRGGGLAADPPLCRSDFRYGHEPAYKCVSIGFRVVLTPG
jgi:hypothetical protein